MYWGSVAKGFRQSDLQHRANRRKVAQMFDEFRRANPEATYEDFQSFIQQAGGGYYNPASDDQLRRFAADGEERKRRRVEQEQMADMMTRYKLDNQFEEMLRGNLLTTNSPSEALKITIDQIGASGEMRGQFADSYAGKIEGMAEQEYQTAAAEVIKTFGPTLAAQGEVNPDWQKYTGRAVSQGFASALNGLWGGYLDNYDLKQYQFAQNELSAVAKAGGDVITAAKGYTFNGPRGQEYTTRLMNYAQQIEGEKVNKTTSSVLSYLNQSSDAYEAIYQRDGLDAAKARAVKAISTTYGYDPMEITPIVSAQFDAFEARWHRGKQQGVADFMNSEQIGKVAQWYTLGMSDEEVVAQLQRENIYPTEAQMAQIRTQAEEVQRRGLVTGYDEGIKGVRAAAKERHLTEQQKWDEEVAKSLANLMNEDVSAVGQWFGDYSLNPDSPLGRQVLAAAGQAARQSNDPNEVREAVEQVFQQFGVPKDEQRAQQVVYEVAQEAELLSPMDLSDFEQEAKLRASKLHEFVTTTVQEANNTHPSEWTPQLIKDIGEATRLMDQEAFMLAEELTLRAKYPKKWLSDFNDLSAVSEQGMNHPAFETAQRLDDFMARVQPQVERLFAMAQHVHKLQGATSPQQVQNELSTMERALESEGFDGVDQKDMFTRFVGSERFNLTSGLVGEQTKLSAEELRDVEVVLAYPPESITNVPDAEGKFNELQNSYRDYRKLHQQYQQELQREAERKERNATSGMFSGLDQAGRRKEVLSQAMRELEQRMKELTAELK